MCYIWTTRGSRYTGDRSRICRRGVYRQIGTDASFVVVGSPEMCVGRDDARLRDGAEVGGGHKILLLRGDETMRAMTGMKWTQSEN